jgi:thiol-disulfide isomerase/thioredoxin
MRPLRPAIALLVVVAACGGSTIDASRVPELPEATSASVATLLETSSIPVVVNVWASWCIPCRSEAPLLERAAGEFEDRVLFVGLNYRDSQDRAREFIAEFFPDAPIDHFIDRSDRIPIDLGGSFGVPQTFFFAAGGELVAMHPAVIDERTLVLQIDEIIARSR